MNKHSKRDIVKLEGSYVKACSPDAKKGSRARAAGYLVIAYAKLGMTQEQITEKMKQLRNEK